MKLVLAFCFYSRFHCWPRPRTPRKLPTDSPAIQAILSPVRVASGLMVAPGVVVSVFTQFRQQHPGQRPRSKHERALDNWLRRAQPATPTAGYLRYGFPDANRFAAGIEYLATRHCSCEHRYGKLCSEGSRIFNPNFPSQRRLFRCDVRAALRRSHAGLRGEIRFNAHPPVTISSPARDLRRHRREPELHRHGRGYISPGM